MAKPTTYISLLVLVLLIPVSAYAQRATLSLSISPTLFEMSANPGQEWSSLIRVTNPNPYELKIFTSLKNFAPEGEAGQGKFIPLEGSEMNGRSLANWITFPITEFTVDPEQTIEVPFSIKVPNDAPPGGHYAAVFIGTKSFGEGSEATILETSQIITSLIFLSVSGDVVEEGSIREFRSQRGVAEKPEMAFELRFQNSGNVHVLPQGEIKIFNMWGQERGTIPVNRQTLFGNVLPDSIRKYTFSWSGEWSIADVGRYTAEVTLAYGQNERKFTSSETSFWVIPWKILGIVLLTLFGFISLLTWAIKAYVRKVLTLAGVSPDMPVVRKGNQSFGSKRRKVSFVAPIEEGILDLRERFGASEGTSQKLSSLIAFVLQYKVFFLVSLAIVLFVIVILLYVRSASVTQRGYEVTINGYDQDVTISSEQLHYDELKENSVVPIGGKVRSKDFPPIKIVNQSGIPGLAAELRIQLENAGYPVSVLTNELDRSEMNTVIIYAPEYDNAALELSGKVYGALTSSYPEASGTDTPIVIYVGKDLENAVQ